MKKIIAGALLILTATAAGASSPDAWAQFDREVARRCVAASGLSAAHTSRMLGFDDSLGKVATLVTGRETLRARRGTTTIALSKLCIYDKKSKRTWTEEASGWSAPPAR